MGVGVRDVGHSVTVDSNRHYAILYGDIETFVYVIHKKTKKYTVCLSVIAQKLNITYRCYFFLYWITMLQCLFQEPLGGQFQGSHGDGQATSQTTGTIGGGGALSRFKCKSLLREQGVETNGFIKAHS